MQPFSDGEGSRTRPTRTYIYALAGRGIASLNMLAIIYFGSRLFSKEQQGFFYALSSIAAAQAIFELGFSTVLIQFIGHEKQRIGPHFQQFLVPDQPVALDAKSRIGEIFRVADRWFLRGGLLCFLTMSILAVLMFRNEPGADWVAPAICTAAAVSINLTFTGRWAIYEGFGFVQDILLARFIAAAIWGALIFTFFFVGQGILVAAAAPFSATIAYLVFIAWKGRTFWHSLVRSVPSTGPGRSDLTGDLFKLQSRTSISFVCGYVSFQCITLIAYKVGSPALAATVGISMTIMLASITIASILVQTQLQKMFRLIAYEQFEAYFSFGGQLIKRCVLAIILVGIIGLLLLLALSVLDVRWLLDRVPTPAVFVLFMGTACINQLISVQATLVRSFKVEPYIGHSICVAVAASFSALVTAPFDDPLVFAAGYFCVNLLIALPYATMIFKSQRRKHLNTFGRVST